MSRQYAVRKINLLITIMGLTEAQLYRHVGPKYKNWDERHVLRLEELVLARRRALNRLTDDAAAEDYIDLIEDLMEQINRLRTSEKDWLANLLKSGKPLWLNDIRRKASEAGYGMRPVTKASRELGVTVTRERGKHNGLRIYWSLT